MPYKLHNQNAANKNNKLYDMKLLNMSFDIELVGW